MAGRASTTYSSAQRMVTNGDVIMVHPIHARPKSATAAAVRTAPAPRMEEAPEAGQEPPPWWQSWVQTGTSSEAQTQAEADATWQAEAQGSGSEQIIVQAGEPWTYTPAPPGYAYEFGTGRLVPLPWREPD